MGLMPRKASYFSTFLYFSLSPSLSLPLSFWVLENGRWVDFLFLTDCYTVHPAISHCWLPVFVSANLKLTAVRRHTHTLPIISSCLVSVCAACHCSSPSVFVFPCVTLWITLTSCWQQESNSKRLSMSQKTQISPNNSCSDWLLVSARAWLFGAVCLSSTWRFAISVLHKRSHIRAHYPYSPQNHMIISSFKCFFLKSFVTLDLVDSLLEWW